MSAALARAAAAILAAVTLGAGLSGCAGAAGRRPDPLPGATAPSAPAASTGAAARRGPAWLLTRAALAEVSSDPAVARRLAADGVDELLTPGQSPLPGARARLVVSFSSGVALQAAVRDRALVPGAAAVLYDPEAWGFTPAAEQRDPFAAAAGAARVARAAGLRFIAAPGLNLVTALSPGARGPRASRFEALRVAGRMASDAEVLELQAQSLERDPAAYRGFVAAAAAQARAANPHVRLLAGLSTNPPGAAVTVAQLRGDVAATRSAVAGYWLNIPGQGARCPSCRAAQPGIAEALLLAP